MTMPGRKFNDGGAYRYGFNGKENDNEVKGEGNQQDYGLRIYDTRLGRFLSVDPLTKEYPHYTPYSYAGNKPIKFIDLDGAEEAKNWMDYNFIDLMNWISKPTNPLKNDGFVHSFGSAFNRNFNPIYYTYVIATGDDPSSSDQGKLDRLGAAQNLTTMIILHKSIGVAVKPSPTVALQQQMSKNAAAMGSTAAAKTVVTDKTTQATSGQATKISAKEIQNIKNYISGLNQNLQKKLVQAVEEDGYAVVRDGQNKVAGKGWLNNGELNLSIKTVDTDLKGRGADVFRTIYDKIHTEFGAISTIRGTWRKGVMGDNLSTFNALIKSGKSVEEAALGTFTGKMSSLLGYKNVSVSGTKDANGVYTSVDVLFKLNP
jgi:RHS repeat-associated protein